MLFEKIGIIDEDFSFKADMYVGVKGETIDYISNEAPAPEQKAHYGDVYDGTGKLLMPGFFNGHAHSPMTLLRGYGENLPLDRWLNERIFPFEAKLYKKAVYWGTLLAMAESARYGIVSTSDMYFFIDDMVRAISESGEKVNIATNVTNFTGQKPEELQCYKDLVNCILMYDGFQDGRVKTDACLHGEYTSDEATARAIAELAKHYDINVHVHVAETEAETIGCRERHNGASPVKYLADCGLFDQPATAAHCVWLDDDDRLILKEKGVTVAHNPTSNLKLVSGICNVPKLYELGVNVSIGTDSVSSNNSLDFFEEIKLAALLGKFVSGDPAAMKPDQLLYSATRAGALSQGRRDCGLLAKGYKADLIVVDLNVPNMQPIHDVLNNIIYSVSGKDVRMTMVDGRVIYRDGEYLTIDVDRVYFEVEKARKKILSEL